jgi:hypothetical protein
VALASSAMAVGGSQDAAASVLAANGSRLSTGFTLAWRSSDPGVVAVDGQGRVQATGSGSAWVVATAGNARDSALVTVEALPASVEIAEASLSLSPGSSGALTARVLDTEGNRMERAVRWSSSDPGVVSVDAATGRVTAAAAGAAQITASAEGFSDQVTVTVEVALPSAAAIRSALEGFVASLSAGDEDAVGRMWGGDDDSLEDVTDLMGEREFSAALTTVGDPTEQGGAAVVPFTVTGSYRNFAGGGRESTLNLVARLARSGSDWALASVVAQ